MNLRQQRIRWAHIPSIIRPTKDISGEKGVELQNRVKYKTSIKTKLRVQGIP